MKKIFMLLLTLTFAPAFSTYVPAQTAAVEDAPVTWRIGEKEVIAVQAELRRRGYFVSKPSGVLDSETRAAVKAYQSENGLKVTGRIDRVTYESMKLPYPATGKERENIRRGGVIPSVGHGAQDTATGTKNAVVGTTTKVKETTVSGYEKTRDAGVGAVTKTKETAGSVGETTVKGVKSVGRGAQRVTGAIVGRSDEDIQTDVREILNRDDATKRWRSTVKNGVVTIKTSPDHTSDIGTIVSNIRKINGVKSVFVVAQ